MRLLSTSIMILICMIAFIQINAQDVKLGNAKNLSVLIDKSKYVAVGKVLSMVPKNTKLESPNGGYVINGDDEYQIEVVEVIKGAFEDKTFTLSISDINIPLKRGTYLIVFAQAFKGRYAMLTDSKGSIAVFPSSYEPIKR